MSEAAPKRVTRLSCARRQRQQNIDSAPVPPPPAAAARRDGSSVSESDTGSFQSPRKRSAANVSTAKRKKVRGNESSAPVSVDDDKNIHRYPLRSRSTRADNSSGPRNTKFRSGLKRSGSSESDLPLPKAVTPASAIPSRRTLNFDGDSGILPLFAPGIAKCSCPKHCNVRELTGFEYLRHYGEGHLDHLKEVESKEFCGALMPSVNLSTHREGSRHESSTLSSPASCKSSDSDSDRENSPCSTQTSLNTPSADEGPRTPRPDSVISTRARARLGNKDMRFLEQPQRELQRQPFITERMRSILVSWLVEVSIEYNCSTAAYHLAVSLLDQVLDGGPTPTERLTWTGWEEMDEEDYDDEDGEGCNYPKKWFVVHRKDFQTLGCACLWIASKMEDRDPPMMEDFQYISDQSVTTYSLRLMESRVCKFLQFRLQRLHPLQFLSTFLRAGRICQDPACAFQSSVQRNMVTYLMTLGRLSYALTRYPPSVLAAAAVYLSRVTMGLSDEDPDHDQYWTPTLAHFTGYSKEELKNPVFLLYNYQLKAEEMNVAVYQQFSKSKFECVSLRTVPRVEELGYPSLIKYDYLEVEH